MFRWIYLRLMNRKNIGPIAQEGDGCGVHGCSNLATEHWLPSTCALREAGVKVDWVAVCDEHDVQSNEDTTRFFFGNKYDAELAAYRARRLT